MMLGLLTESFEVSYYNRFSLKIERQLKGGILSNKVMVAGLGQKSGR